MLRRFVRWLRLTLCLGLLVVLLAPEWPAFASQEYQLRTVIDQRHFDFLVWELEALAAKVAGNLSGGHRFLAEPARRELVLTYLANLAQAQQLEADINRIFIDPNIAEPDTASADLQLALAVQRQILASQQTTAEAIVQEQVAAVLANEGFTLLGQTWPPVAIRLTPLPSFLVISPRDRIEQIHQFPLLPTLTTSEKEDIESAIYEDLDLSALVERLAGLNAFPAMVTETSNLSRLIEVTAHEWVHHWLGLHPLGVLYASDPQLRTINETVASLADQEIMRATLARFYPEQATPSAPDSPTPTAEEPPEFDFRAEMAATRARVDELLAAKQIDEAEAYMEARRRVFVDNGYQIRKLNQAYFAFRGAYAAEPGARGEDPIGPLLRQLRERSPSLKAFLEQTAGITSFEDLRRLAQAE